MNEQTLTRVWGMRLAFALIVCVVLFFHLLPLETTPRRWVAPDLILAFAFAWSLRRPDSVPAPVLAGLFLLTDLALRHKETRDGPADPLWTDQPASYGP